MNPKALPALLLLAASTVTSAFAAPATCPQLEDQLGELLAGAKQRIARDGEVSVTFDVDAQGRARFVGATGSRHYRAPVRLALDALDCRAGEPKRYVLNIRFADPATVLAAAAPAASATVAQAAGTP